MCREIKNYVCRVRKTYNREQTGFRYLTVQDILIDHGYLTQKLSIGTF
jgi:hypothetical protein